jgi:photosystem II stability/assembly factor-like uncharacterized protein
MKSIKSGVGIILLLVVCGLAIPSAEGPRFNESWFAHLAWRNLGPYRTGAWLTAIAVPDTPAAAHLYTFYVGFRNGGVWKTVNNGTTFEPVFDAQPSLSIGAIAVAPSDQNVVWVGTGEAYGARSSYSGTGVYRSTDAGRSWTHMGLADTQHISRVLIHPADPNTVYVAAMGHLFTTNAERGLFKTVDGGKTWQKVLFVNDSTGVIDLVMNTGAPAELYAVTYELHRTPWDLDIGGPGSGIWKTTDGGAHWVRLGGGLPTGRIGRIGIDLFQANPRILYAIVENANTRPATAQEAERDAARPKPPEYVVGNQVYRSNDAGHTWTLTHDPRVSVGSKAAYSFNILRIDPGDPNHIAVISDAMPNSSDGGKTWQGTSWPPEGMFVKAFGDFRALWWDRQNPQRIIAGSDGGLNTSYDRGKTVDHFVNLPVGEFYTVESDMEDPYNLYGGMQDHDSWKAPSNGWSGSVNIADWLTVGEGDGMYNKVDPTDSRWLINSREFGSHRRVDQVQRTSTDIMPRRPAGQAPYRWNWTPPIALSPRDPATVYTGAQVLLRSKNRGDNWQEISPDLTTNVASKTYGRGNLQHCTLTTISESPAAPGVIWTGSDDGRVQVTKDDGTSWTDVTGAIAAAGGPVDRWVSRVHASPHAPGTAFVTKTGFRADDFTPYLFRTMDFGATWTRITNGLPQQPVNVIWQDRVNPHLLFAGTDKGVWVSIDDGGRWTRMKGTMPDVPVHDLHVHPREHDLIVATYGRALFITDIYALQQLSEDVLAEPVHVFDIEARKVLRTSGWGNYDFYGDRYTPTPNEADDAVVQYSLREALPGQAVVRVSDASGQVIRTLEGPLDAGLNAVAWDLRDGRRRLQSAGDYGVSVDIGGQVVTKSVRIRR